MKSFKSFIVEEQSPKEGGNGKKISVGKSTVKINPNSEELKEVSPPGAKYERMVKHIKKSYSKGGLTDKEKSIAYATAWKQKNQDTQESAVPGQPAERLGAVTAIPADEREAAKQRTLAKAAALRKKREEQKEEFEIEEGMSMKDFKANRKKNVRRAASADAEKRGHVGKEWHNTGRKYSPDEAKSGRANMSDYNRQQKYQTAEDPDSDNADTYPAVKTKNPKKLRKQKAMGEMVSFSAFMEARAEDKRGLEPTGANRKKQKTGVKLPGGGEAHPATSYSGGQNPHLRGKGGGNKEQRRAASRRYVDQPGGAYAKPENKQGEGRYAAMQAKKRDRSHMSSRFD
jgi:hypothetical protein